MDTINYMAIYLDDSCEVHFSNENSKVILTPCGSEFMYLTYSDSMTSGSFKYRTAYATSRFSTQLPIILKQRNRFCERPFISPSLLEQTNSYWLSSENLTEFKWTLNDYLNKNQIEIDYHSFMFIWKSTCKKAMIKLHFNKSCLLFKYPIRVPTNEMDEYEQKYDITNTARNFNGKIKNIFKYTYNEQEYSTRHLPVKYKEIYEHMIELVDRMDREKSTEDYIDLLEENSSKKTEFLTLTFENALPLTCESTHLHRFDHVQALSEPKIIFANQTWYKLFYKDNKSIELSCPSNTNQIESLPPVDAFTTATSILEKSDELCTCVDYLISDTPTGRYYTCYSLNERSGQIDELKICMDNIPSFKQNLKKLLNYSNILLKRLNTINYVANYLTCSDLADKKAKLNSIVDSEVKIQSVIPNVGHFKYFHNNTILIQFIDKIKLYVDSNSINGFHSANFNNMNHECNCTLVLPDMSQHEINFSSPTNETALFGKYIDFLLQWLRWILPEKFELSPKKGQNPDEDESDIDINSIKYHVNKLKLFNFTIDQELNYDTIEAAANEQQKAGTNNTSIYDSNTINDLLRANSDFLKNISK